MINKELLLIDDDSYVWREIEDLCQEIGLKVTAVSSGEAALALVNEQPNRFPVAIIDYGLPGVSGAQVGQAIRKINCHILCFMYSGDGSVDTIHQAYKVGRVERFIQKDESRSKLQSKIIEAFTSQEQDHGSRFWSAVA